MRDFEAEIKNRTQFIRETMKAAGAKGLVFGNSGGKDCALVGILCKMACADSLGLVMPCGSKRNYGEDKEDAEALSEQYNIAMRSIDLTEVKKLLTALVGKETQLTDSALANFAPRLRMIALYAVAASENRLVAGTGNRSERYMGYFTKWGDGACDFNPIADLTVTEVYDFLRYLKAPPSILEKAPSAGLFEGQTDEDEMGVSYRSIDAFLLTGKTNREDTAIIERYHSASAHKRRLPPVYEG